MIANQCKWRKVFVHATHQKYSHTHTHCKIAIIFVFFFIVIHFYCIFGFFPTFSGLVIVVNFAFILFFFHSLYVCRDVYVCICTFPYQMNAITRAKKIELDAKLHNSYVVLSSFEWICTNISSSALRFCLYFNCFLFLSSAERLRPPANCCVFGCTINDCSQNERIHKTHSTLRQIYEGTVFIYTRPNKIGEKWKHKENYFVHTFAHIWIVYAFTALSCLPLP